MQLQNSNVQQYLLVGVHLGLVRLGGDVLLDFALDGRHRNVGDAAVVQAFLEGALLSSVRQELVQIDLQVC